MSAMRVLVAGASGVVGRALVPGLLARGHEVTGLVRSEDGAALVRAAGANAVIADALDCWAVQAVFAAARPEAVIHQLTAIDPAADLRRFDRAFAATNALRMAGTDHLVAAARMVGVRRFVAQSFCGWTWARTGGPVKDEDAPLDPDPPAEARATLAAIRHLEAAMLAARDIGGVALRYGGFYGAGTGIARQGAVAAEIRRRRFPVIGRGGGVWSFIHIDDVASATLAALEDAPMGVFNVVDDEPAPVRDWLPTLAERLGAAPPRRLPLWLARLLLPRHLVAMMTEARGASNHRFKAAFDWQPRWPSWRDGFREGLE